MSPEQGSSPERGKDDEHKQKVQIMLGLVVDDVHEEDFEAATHTTIEQGLISPADIIDYLSVLGKNEEDPVAQRRVRDGIRSIVAGLRERDQAENGSGSDRSLANDEVERINKVIQDMELHEMAENEVLAEEPDVQMGQDIEPDYEWDDDIFSPDLSDYTDEEIEKARNSVGFKNAVDEAQEYSTTGREYQIREARKLIDQQGGRYKELQLLMFDEFVSKAAEEEAQEYSTMGREYQIREARKLIERFASDQDQGNSIGDVASETYERLSRIGSRSKSVEHSQPNPPEPKAITSRMLASLDKHIARAARDEAQEYSTMGREYQIREARKLINYASSPERAQAMLDKLGL